ncbi:MAG TPA: hypothetical protein VH210_00175 [Gaiellaceae bacterium]|jgi:hypothetical protein|nr:hypothetical protein [Gaiellaceae bacterium]
MDDLQKGRLAQNEDFFRSVNERVNEKAESHGLDSHRYEFFCECSDTACMERILLTLPEYEYIRAAPARFVVKKNHVIQEIEGVIETVSEHVVIEKHGEAGKIAVELEAESGSE